MEDIVHALITAETDTELNAALLRATPYNNSDVMRDAIVEAKERQERRRRIAMLTASQPSPITRQDSHQERIAYLLQAQTNRSLGLEDETLSRSMKDTCKDFRCPDCGEGGAYKSVCINFMLQCLAIRIRTRITYDKLNQYKILPETTALLQEFVDNPQKFWLDEHPYFRKIPDMLDKIYDRIVQPTVVDEHTQREAAEYYKHKESIRKIVDSILRCEAANNKSGK